MELSSARPSQQERPNPRSRFTSLPPHALAAGQLLTATLLLHLAGPQAGHQPFLAALPVLSLIALAIAYSDWQVLATATAALAAGQLLWPAQAAISLQNACWLALSDALLIAACIVRAQSLAALARLSLYHQSLRQELLTDPLTGLPNRLSFEREIERALAHAPSSFALLYVDLDRLKSVNSTHGHAMGDRVLAIVAERLTQPANDPATHPATQPAPTRFSRIGGDEFAAILPRSGPCLGPISDRASHLLSQLLAPLQIDGVPIHIGASIGISLYPEDGLTAGRLLANAGTAMDSVKSKGRRGFTFYKRDMDASDEDRSAAAERLRQAIAAQEFSVFYQPLIHAAGPFTAAGPCIVDGLEALVRWRKPAANGQAGPDVCPPSEFIPLAEETGLIASLGQSILEQVCRQLALWHAAHVPFGEVAINLSPRQLETGAFLPLLDETMFAYGIRPHWIAFEITESALADNRLLEAAVESLRSRGIRVSLDDFGTGYSSLGRLQTLAFDTLKIDRIFVSGLGQSSAADGMVKTILDLAHLLHMSVVAEGVETAAQAAILTQLGCDHLQGYYFSRPLSADAATAYLLQHAPNPQPAAGTQPAADTRLASSPTAPPNPPARTPAAPAASEPRSGTATLEPRKGLHLVNEAAEPPAATPSLWPRSHAAI